MPAGSMDSAVVDAVLSEFPDPETGRDAASG
jgi:hypothetical protein